MADKGYATAPSAMPMPMPYSQAQDAYQPVQPPPPYNAYPAPEHQHQQQQHMSGGQQQQQQPQPRTIVTHVYAVAPAVGPDPSSMQCPSCRQTITTRLDYETTTKTHLMAALLCCFICWPCAWVPYVMDSCKNANHYCPNCSAFIGTYKS